MRAASPQSSFVPSSPQATFMPQPPTLNSSHAQLVPQPYLPMHGMVAGDGLGVGSPWVLVHSTSPRLMPSFPGQDVPHSTSPGTLMPRSPRHHLTNMQNHHRHDHEHGHHGHNVRAEHKRHHQEKASSSKNKKKQSVQSPVLGPQSREPHDGLQQELADRQQKLIFAQQQLSETLDKVTNISMLPEIVHLGETLHRGPAPTTTSSHHPQLQHSGATATATV